MNCLSSIIPHWIILAAAISITACSSNDKATHKTTKTANVVPPTPVVKKWSTEDAKKAAEAKFATYLPKILKDHDGVVDVQESHTGDFTGDGIEDVAIYFSLSPAGGGNMNVGTGLTLYKNTGTAIEVIAGFEPGYQFIFTDIHDGKIHIQKIEYAPEDGFCCPSIRTDQILTLHGNTVTASDADQAQQ